MIIVLIVLLSCYSMGILFWIIGGIFVYRYNGEIQWGFSSVEHIVAAVNKNAIVAAVWTPVLKLLDVESFCVGELSRSLYLTESLENSERF